MTTNTPFGEMIVELSGTAARPKRRRSAPTLSQGSTKMPMSQADKAARDRRIKTINKEADRLQAERKNLARSNALKLAGAAWTAGKLGEGGGKKASGKKAAKARRRPSDRLAGSGGAGQLGARGKKKKKKKSGRRATPSIASGARSARTDLERFIAPFAPIKREELPADDVLQAAAVVHQLAQLYAWLTMPGMNASIMNLFFEPQIIRALDKVPLRAGAKRLVRGFLNERNIFPAQQPASSAQVSTNVSARIYSDLGEFFDWVRKRWPFGLNAYVEHLRELAQGLGVVLPQGAAADQVFQSPYTAANLPAPNFDATIRRILVWTRTMLPRIMELPGPPRPSAPGSPEDQFGPVEQPVAGYGNVDPFGPDMMGRGMPAIEQVDDMGFPVGGVDYAGLGDRQLDADLDALLLGDSYGQSLDDILDPLGVDPNFATDLQLLGATLDPAEIEAIDPLLNGYDGLDGLGQQFGPNEFDPFIQPELEVDPAPPALFGRATQLGQDTTFTADDEDAEAAGEPMDGEDRTDPFSFILSVGSDTEDDGTFF